MESNNLTQLMSLINKRLNFTFGPSPFTFLQFSSLNYEIIKKRHQRLQPFAVLVFHLISFIF